MILMDAISEWAKTFNIKFYSRPEGTDYWITGGREVYGLLFITGREYPHPYVFWHILDDGIKFPDEQIVLAVDPELFNKLEKSINQYKGVYGINS